MTPTRRDRAAYRARLAVRRRDISHGHLAAQVEQLEAALAAMSTRAETAERRAIDAERRAASALEQVRALKLSVAGLQHRLETTPSVTDANPVTGMNRQARRRAERDARRRQR